MTNGNKLCLKMMKGEIDEVWANGWDFPKHVWPCLSQYEKSFVRNEFLGIRTLDYYSARLRTIGFEGMQKVLDAGCGMGQWSIALSRLNQKVEGVDINMGRLLVAQDLAQSMGKKQNCNFSYSSLESLPFEDGSLDGIFCYGTFMFTNMEKTLNEFHRKLGAGGIMYLNANTWGQYAHLLFDRGLRGRNWSLIKSAIKMTLKTFLRPNQNALVRENWLRRKLIKTGFSEVMVGDEGGLQINSNVSRVRSAYPSAHYGMRNIIEVVARR